MVTADDRPSPQATPNAETSPLTAPLTAPTDSAHSFPASALAAVIDHTLLRPEAQESDIEKLCDEARVFGFKAVCVNPIFVHRCRSLLVGSPVLTASVVGFPLGASLARIKALEAELAARDGADEIDMVIRLDLVKAGQWLLAEADVAAVVRAVDGRVVKVILETGLLTAAQIENACRVAENAGASFVKTATGLLGRGATVEDIVLMRRSCSNHIQIKASGGVKTVEQARALIAAGASRIGTSSGVALVSGASTPASDY
jgi:deoxyribose-phosphate aldolase